MISRMLDQLLSGASAPSQCDRLLMPRYLKIPSEPVQDTTSPFLTIQFLPSRRSSELPNTPTPNLYLSIQSP